MPVALVIDDTAADNQGLCYHLEMLGFSTESAYSGAEGVERCASMTPDLVVIDLIMAGISGWETARSLRELDGMSEAFIVILTSQTRSEAHNRLWAQGPEVGANEYLVKPGASEDFNWTSVSEQVQTLFEKARQEVA